jgi:hypothetical protein
MKTQIIITIDNGLLPREVDDVAVLLLDAFGEFATHRYPAEDYVERRYPNIGVGRIDKIVQVRRRIDLATKLNHASHTAKIVTDGDARSDTCISLLMDLFGMEEEEARATYNQLEDKRVNKQISAAFAYAAGGS